MVSQVIEVGHVRSVLDIGCGDGRVAARIRLHGASYLGVDPSREAVRVARKAAPARRFQVLDKVPSPRDLHLSLDVLFHLPDDEEFHRHLDLVFSAKRLAAIHATDFDAAGPNHVRHRHWTDHVPAGWRLVAVAESGRSRADLYVLERTG